MDKRQIRVVPTDDSGWRIDLRDKTGEEYTLVTLHNIPNVPGFELPTNTEGAVEGEFALSLAGLITGEIMARNPTVECTLV